MNFINPFDLLEIETTDSDAIKKAKRHKLADIELKDGFLEFRNQKTSKSEFIQQNRCFCKDMQRVPYKP
jgi:hypothetical protein